MDVLVKEFSENSRNTRNGDVLVKEFSENSRNTRNGVLNWKVVLVKIRVKRIRVNQGVGVLTMY